MRILLVEDNEKLSGLVKEILVGESYHVDQARTGVEGETMAHQSPYDLIILDIMLPEKDGISVCHDLRERGVLIPILMLTAKGEVDDRVLGLDAGADDYLTKPFAMDELLARVRALLRRPQKRMYQETLRCRDIEIVPARHKVIHAGTELALTLKEYTVLEYLVRNHDAVVTRDALLAGCWDFAYDAESNIVDVYIKRLRKKLHDTDESYIKTIRGVGYTLQA